MVLSLLKTASQSFKICLVEHVLKYLKKQKSKRKKAVLFIGPSVMEVDRFVEFIEDDLKAKRGDYILQGINLSDFMQKDLEAVLDSYLIGPNYDAAEEYTFAVALSKIRKQRYDLVIIRRPPLVSKFQQRVIARMIEHSLTYLRKDGLLLVTTLRGGSEVKYLREIIDELKGFGFNELECGGLNLPKGVYQEDTYFTLLEKPEEDL
ncbi:MAG: hypothetical protein ABIF92_01065 [archaeon]